MGKMKTKKAVAKRFRRTARGKIMSARGFKSHLLTGKSRNRKRHLRKHGRVSHGMEKQISIALGK